MKRVLNNSANLLIMAIMVLAMAFTFSCSTDDIKDSIKDGIDDLLNNDPSYVELPANAIALTQSQWTQGSIAAYGRETWYKFEATSAVSYAIFWKDCYMEGSGVTADIVVHVFDSKGEQLFSGYNTGGRPGLIPPLEVNGAIYIRVTRISEEGSTFEIMYDISG
jgi:hypothetical protein